MIILCERRGEAEESGCGEAKTGERNEKEERVKRKMGIKNEKGETSRENCAEEMRRK